MPSSPDPIEQLQAAARHVAARHVPGAIPARVAILGPDGEPLLVVAVPAAAGRAGAQDESPGAAGWDVTERRALFDGRLIGVARSRLKLLGALAAADAPLPAAELLGTAFDRHTSEKNVRFHVAELRKELAAAFPEFDGDAIETSGAGYVLVVR